MSNDNRLLFQIFKEANFNKLYNITTYDKLLQLTLSPSPDAPIDGNEQIIDKVASISEVIQTCTRDAKFTHEILRAASLACWTAGRSNPTNVTMMAITTRSSIRVNAFRLFNILLICF